MIFAWADRSGKIEAGADQTHSAQILAHNIRPDLEDRAAFQPSLRRPVFGLFLAIPIYLVIRIACRWGQWKRGEIPSSRKPWLDLFALLLGGLSLATANPIWFQLEVTLIAVFALAGWIVSRRSLLADIEPFPAVSLIGETPAGITKSVFIFGLIAAPVFNLWLALQFSETVWLLFRTLGFFLWIAGFAALGYWFIAKKAEQEAN